MVAGLEKYVGKQVQQRSSSPKLQVFNTALISAFSPHSFQEAQQDRDYWGRLVESAVGAYLLNSSLDQRLDTYYWRDGNQEVDFVLQAGKKIIPIEVKSYYHKNKHPGTEIFCQKYKVLRTLLVGGQGLSIEKFLSEPVETWVG